MLVVVEDGGGLANRLFVFANVIVAGIATGHRVANPAFRGWAKSFEGTAGDSLSFYPRRPWALFGDRVSARIVASLSYRLSKPLARSIGSGPLRAITLNWPQHCDLEAPATMADLQRRRLVLLKGWLFRSPSGIDSHGAALRDFFRPVPAIRRQAEAVVDAARSGGDLVVGVHVRHRDYRVFRNGEYFYPFETYVALMRSLAAKVAPRKASFLVCSDEAQDISGVEEPPVTLSTMGPVHDLWALSRCDLVMGPPSTYSAWAAFLGETPLWEIGDPDREPDPTRFTVPSPVPRLPTQHP
jgi:hypothetical protein